MSTGAILLTAVPLLLLVVAVVVVYSMVETVDEDELKLLVVSGEPRAVLEPGLNMVPPFISKTHPIDPATMTYDTHGDRRELPQQFHDEVTTLAE